MLKLIIAVWLFNSLSEMLGAQEINNSNTGSINGKLKLKNQFLVRFEKFDTTETPGKTFTISRSYYFDGKNRTIRYVETDKTQDKKKKGERRIYTFSENQLINATIIPPKSECRKCGGEYYYWDGHLIGKKEMNFNFDHPETFVTNAMWLKPKVPDFLPWGHFQNEVLVNGQMKTKGMY
jgi:hypothetical protein